MRAKVSLTRRIKDAVRRFNKHILNPVMLRIVPRTRIFAVLEHRGRRSGKTYRTPIVVRPSPEGFLIALTYGDHVDWYRNLQAAGGVLEWQGRRYEVGAPETVAVETALPAFPATMQRMLRRAGVIHYIRVPHRQSE